MLNAIAKRYYKIPYLSELGNAWCKFTSVRNQIEIASLVVLLLCFVRQFCRPKTEKYLYTQYVWLCNKKYFHLIECDCYCKCVYFKCISFFSHPNLRRKKYPYAKKKHLNISFVFVCDSVRPFHNTLFACVSCELRTEALRMQHGFIIYFQIACDSTWIIILY